MCVWYESLMCATRLTRLEILVAQHDLQCKHQRCHVLVVVTCVQRALQCNVACCSVLQYIAVCCNMCQCVAQDDLWCKHQRRQTSAMP